MTKRFGALLVLLAVPLVVVVGAGCDEDDDTMQEADASIPVPDGGRIRTDAMVAMPDAAPEGPKVYALNNVFMPMHLTVKVGDTVKFENQDPYAHTVTSGESSRPNDQPGVLFDAMLPAGATFEFTFTTVGDVPYFCRIHEDLNMTGMITVTQ